MSDHTDMQDKYFGVCYDIHHIQSQYTQVAAYGRHHKRGDAAFGCATSCVVSLVLALNNVNIVAVITLLVLHVGNGRSEHVRLEAGDLGGRRSMKHDWRPTGEEHDIQSHRQVRQLLW